MTPRNHLDEQTMAEIRPGVWIPAIPLPMFLRKSFFKEVYGCFCGEVFNSQVEYELHYRTEQMLEMNHKMARTRDLAKAKLLFWRRFAFVMEHGTKIEKTEAKLIESPEMKTIDELEPLIARMTDVWSPVYRKYATDNDVTIGRVKDDTEITDDDPADAAKDMADKFYSHTNSKGVTYFLHETTVTLRGGKEQQIYFFRKEPVTHHPKWKQAMLPDGWSVRENPRNGFLTVSRPEVRHED